MTAVFNIIYKLGGATNIIIGLSLIEGIKTVINIFIFVLSCGTPRLSRLK
jgi:hypothetical protein